MKNIKIVLIALLGLISLSAGAQTFNVLPTTSANTAGPYANWGHTGWSTLNGTICAVISNTVTPLAAGKLDTLGSGGNVGIADTGYLQFTINSGWDLLFDFAVTKISGTVAGTSLLQGSIDNATWFTLTGNTTTCAGCQGASCTVTNATGTKHYQWFIPKTAATYPYYQIQTITTPTCTASYNGIAGYRR